MIYETCSQAAVFAVSSTYGNVNGWWDFRRVGFAGDVGVGEGHHEVCEAVGVQSGHNVAESGFPLDEVTRSVVQITGRSHCEHTERFAK